MRAWWEGAHVDEPALADPAAARAPRPDPGADEPLLLDVAALPLLLDTPAPPAPGAPEPLDPARPWTPRRIEAAEAIWGADFLAPGGAALTVQLAKPFGMTSAHQLLQLGADIGGGTRALAQAFGVWITALEPDTELAAEAAQRSKAARLEKKAVVRPIALDGLELRERGFDFVFSREFLFSCPDREALLATLHRGLKDRGQIILTDLVLRGGSTPALRSFIGGELTPPDLWPARRMTQALQVLGFDLRIDEDMTDTYLEHAAEAWAALAHGLDGGTIPRRLLRPVSDECERWGRRLQAMESGALGVYRYHAIK